MKIDYMKLAGIVNVPVRLAMGFGVGLFVRKAAQTINLNYESNLSKVATWMSAVCVTWATCHAVDSWCDKAVSIYKDCNDLVNMSENYTNEE